METLDLCKIKSDGLDKPPAVSLTPKETEVRVAWTDPDTGKTLRTVAVSKLPVDRAALGRSAATMARGVPWESYPPAFQSRFVALSRVAHQLDVPEDAEWLSVALATNDHLLFSLEAALTEHERLYFLGDVAEGGETTRIASVELPAIHPASAPGKGG